MSKDPLRSQEMYFNRELSWLEFNDRVLRQGLADDLPLLERVKFLSIVSSNLDEFFPVRVAGLMQARAEGVRGRDPAGMTPATQLKAISERVHRMVRDQAKGPAALGQLAAGTAVLAPPQWTDRAAAVSCKTHFSKEVLPVLTPLAVQELQPPPRLPGCNGMWRPCWHARRPTSRSRRRPCPSNLPLGPLPAEDVVAWPAGRGDRRQRRRPYPGAEVLATAHFRITRDADVSVDRGQGDDMLEAVERAVLTRQRRPPVRLQSRPAPIRRVRAVAGRAG